MPRKPRAKRTDSSRNIPARMKELDARLAELEKGIDDDVQQVAADAVPELVRTEMRGLFVRWSDDLAPK